MEQLQRVYIPQVLAPGVNKVVQLTFRVKDRGSISVMLDGRTVCVHTLLETFDTSCHFE